MWTSLLGALDDNTFEGSWCTLVVVHWNHLRCWVLKHWPPVGLHHTCFNVCRRKVSRRVKNVQMFVSQIWLEIYQTKQRSPWSWQVRKITLCSSTASYVVEASCEDNSEQWSTAWHDSRSFILIQWKMCFRISSEVRKSSCDGLGETTGQRVGWVFCGEAAAHNQVWLVWLPLTKNNNNNGHPTSLIPEGQQPICAKNIYASVGWKQSVCCQQGRAGCCSALISI